MQLGQEENKMWFSARNGTGRCWIGEMFFFVWSRRVKCFGSHRGRRKLLINREIEGEEWTAHGYHSDKLSQVVKCMPIPSWGYHWRSKCLKHSLNTTPTLLYQAQQWIDWSRSSYETAQHKLSLSNSAPFQTRSVDWRPVVHRTQ